MEERIIKDVNNLLIQLLQKMREAGYEWDAENKRLITIEQNPVRPVCYNNMDDLIADAMINEINESNLPESSKHNRIFWIKSHRQKRDWSEEDEKNLKGIITEIETNKNDAPDYDLATYDRFLSWLKSIKDRVQPQPKQEWSEEDKYMLKVVGNLTLAGYKEYPHPDIPSLEIIRDWLKSLKPNYWKPSEQNIKDLEWCADLVKDKMGVGFHRLQVFIDEIKKL